MKSFDDVVMTMMCEEGNIAEYSDVYLEMWRPCAPVQVISRIRDGAEPSSTGVDGAREARSHIVGNRRSKPGMASCGALVLTIVL